MAKPVLLTVDDDPEVLRAIERDLRRHYGSRFRVLRADSGPTALDLLQQLTARNAPVALLLVDQRMPHMTGVDFLAQARELHPDAKRVLLTAYADTDAAIRAINQVQIQYYLLKPWDPPEQQLYPMLDDLLDDWLAAYRPPFEGIRVVGTRWAPASFAVRDFLGRHQVPFRWLDVETSAEGRRLAAPAGEPLALPLVLCPDGSWLEAPAPAAIAEQLGLRTHAEKPFYDLVVVGGGPAGLAAAVYGASEGLCTALVEREAPGGQAGQSSRIENYLGFPSGLSGADLTRRAVAQASRFGAEILTPVEATGIRIEGSYRLIQLADGTEVTSHALLIAAGVSYRKLDVPGCDQLKGAGVYYGAAMTEASSTKGDDVYVVGGANSAGQAALFFARHARTVTILVRGAGLAASMSQYLIDEIERTANVVVRPRTQVVEVFGPEHLEAIAIADGATGTVERVPASTLFVFIGAQPRTEWLADVVERDEYGFILTGPDLLREGKRPKGWPLDRDPYLLESSVPGVFAAGDVRHGSAKRVASGVGEGSVAISFVHQYLSNVRS
jgi:thioredoxin reductase (NADPH)